MVWWTFVLGGVFAVRLVAADGAHASRATMGHPAEHDHPAAHAEHHQREGNAFAVPQPLNVEHQELHVELGKATQEAGPVGEAAKNVAALLKPHFVKEEEHALPLLGLLVPLSKGSVVPEARKAIAMAEKLKAELAQMCEEHRRITAALDILQEAATNAGKTEYVEFAQRLRLHAATEEQVLYPAAILVGEHLKLALSE
jgi:hypothetical protein